MIRLTIKDLYDGNLVFYAGIHSGDGAIVYPWGYDPVRPRPNSEPGRLAKQAVALANLDQE
jgi:hypothetical protein